MDAIVLVGGQGTRLRPLTATRHKSLVPVCNRPAIGYLFEWLRKAGFDRAVLAIGHPGVVRCEDVSRDIVLSDHRSGPDPVPDLLIRPYQSGAAGSNPDAVSRLSG